MLEAIDMAEALMKSDETYQQKQPIFEEIEYTEENKKKQDIKKRGYTLIEEQFNEFKLDLPFMKQVMVPNNLDSKENQGKEEEVEKHNQSVLNLYLVFHQIVVVLSDLKAGVLDLPRVVDPARKHTLDNFISYMQVFETFGTGFDDDIDIRKYKIRDKETHR